MLLPDGFAYLSPRSVFLHQVLRDIVFVQHDMIFNHKTYCCYIMLFFSMMTRTDVLQNEVLMFCETRNKMDDGNNHNFEGLFGDKCRMLSMKSTKSLLEFLSNSGNDALYFTCNGKKLCPDLLSDLPCAEGLLIRGHVRVLGGKGGFGSMLRAIGAQIEKTTNREACRDLSGRRMRDVNNEKAINDWLEKQKEQEEDKAKRKKEKLERILNPPRHIMHDSSYVAEIKATSEKVDDALRQGLLKKSNSQPKMPTASPGKRHLPADKKPDAKKQKMWLEFDSDESLDGDDDEEELGHIASAVEDKGEQQSNFPNFETKSPSPERDEMKDITDNEGTISKNTKYSTENNEENVMSHYDIKDKVKLNEVKQSEAESKPDTSGSTLDSIEGIDLQSTSRAEDLEVFGLERLKKELMKYGLKCGGTLKQRAERLFLLKDTPVEEIDKSLFAKATKNKPSHNT